jgi:hypothetical protein
MDEYERLKELVFLLQAENDRLQAEVERFRWHRPDQGDLPNLNSDVIYEHGSTVTCGVYGNGYYGNGELGFYAISSPNPIKSFFVIRWKYVYQEADDENV